MRRISLAALSPYYRTLQTLGIYLEIKILLGKARQGKFYTTVVDPKCFTLKITEFKRER